nr:C10 family peptidase [uncultured Desulfobacter sp.]
MSRLLKTIASCLIIFYPAVEVHAARMDETQILQAAGNWMDRNKVFQQEAGKGNISQVETISVIAVDEQNYPLAYHIDLSPKGYIIISGNDLIAPVIAFSAQSDLNFQDLRDNAFRTLLMGDLDYCRQALAQLVPQAKAAGSDQNTSLSKNQRLWQKLLATESSLKGLTADTAGDTPLIGPLMTTTWDQNRHYNALCPMDSQASDYYYGRMPVGCVATAAGQLMKYYNWPAQGTSSHSYIDQIEGVNTLLDAQFFDPYDWSAMQNDYDPWGEEPQTAVDAVSELLYEIGVSVEMDYDHTGSSASVYHLNSSLSSYFYYETGNYIFRSSNETAFDAAMRNNMIAQQVVVATYPGHAIVVDGLDQEDTEDFYHINYGWGGTNNGWYRLTEVPISASGSTTSALLSGLFDILPQFLPLLQDFTDPIDTDGQIDIIWNFPEVRRAEVTQFQVLLGQYEPIDFFDSCDDLSNWSGSSYWQVEPGQGYTATGFYMPPNILGIFDLNLTDPVRATSDTTLSFQYKAVLIDAHLLLQTSADNGNTWVTHLDVTDTPGGQDWIEAQIDLAVQPEDLLIRFRYEFEGGGAWTVPDGGVWLDDIEISNAELLVWQVAGESLTPETDQYRLNLDDGTYSFCVQAADSQGWGPRSPIKEIVVETSGIYADFNQDNDVDGSDLATFIANGNLERLSEVAGNFGRQG